MSAEKDHKYYVDKASYFSEKCSALVKLYLEKNERYGDAFSNDIKEYGLISAVIMLGHKIKRLKHLVQHPEDNGGDESIYDTLKDLASYSIMTLMELSHSAACNSGSGYYDESISASDKDVQDFVNGLVDKSKSKTRALAYQKKSG